ncbi:MAG: RagB/SusD family nutrient uptake outer membrane protein [Chitinophagaceae bacterium]
MKLRTYSIAVLAATGLLVNACTKTSYVNDPNNPTVESVLTNATRVQIDQLGVGVQGTMRSGLFAFYTWSGSIGREVVYFQNTESRYYRELQGEIAIDPAGIMYDWYFGFNQTRRRAEILLRSADKSAALSDAEKAAVKGFAKTIQAFVMLNALNMEGTNGIRTSFSDLNTPGDLLRPGCFGTYETSMTYIKTLVDDGLAALNQASTAFPFRMVTGWAGFDNPANFKKFNRAMAARVAMYQKDWQGLRTALAASFMAATAGLNDGPKFLYSTTAGDAINPFWQTKDEPNAAILVQANFVPDAETGDNRVFGNSVADGGIAKVRRRTTASAPPGYPAMAYELQQYAATTSPVSIIRNEELLLMSAEADIQLNSLPDAVTKLSNIRVAHNLAVYSGAVTKDALTTELLKQRRYSLFMEGHRWFDARRYNLLNTLPKDNATHNVWVEYPHHKQDDDWDAVNPCK